MRGDSGDIFVNQLARKFVGTGKRQRLSLTGTSGDTGTDEETQVRYLPEFEDEGDILQLIIDDDGDLVASWENPEVLGGGGRYRQFIIELDGMGGFNFVLDVDGSPVMSLESTE